MIENMKGLDLAQFNLANATSAQMAARIGEDMEHTRKINQLEYEKREQRASENHDNIAILANNSYEAIEALKENNSLLREQKEALEKSVMNLQSSLDSIVNILGDIFTVDYIHADDEKKLLQEANALACEIAVSLESGERIDWKDKVIDGGVQAAVAGIGVVLKNRGIIR